MESSLVQPALPEIVKAISSVLPGSYLLIEISGK